MMLGRVIGEVWATRRAGAFGHRKAMLVATLAREGDRLFPTGEVVVALDDIGARRGNVVTVSWGSGARAVFAPPDNRHVLVDAAISRVVDAITLDESGRVLDLQHEEG